MTRQTCLHKQEKLVHTFSLLTASEDVYKKIISLGQNASTFPESKKIEENLVKGCQSRTYIIGEIHESLISFFYYSEAFISAGIACLFRDVYSQEDPETILTCPPLFFEKLRLSSLLSPSRSNGALSLHLKMKQIALQFLTQSPRKVNETFVK